MLPHITVIIGHCHPQFRIILQNIIRSHQRLCLVAIASTAVELIQLALSHVPDIIIADVALPGMDELNLAACLAAIRNPAQFVFSWHYHHESLLRPFIARPVSYIARDTAPAEYGIAIRQAMKGTPYVCTQTKKLMDSPAGSLAASLAKKVDNKYSLLIYCERLGFNCKETAVGTDLSEQSVRIYRTRYKELLGSRSLEILMLVWTKLIENRTSDP